MKNKYNVPILFIVYKRPSLTRIVFNEIREIKPTQLFIFADGPKEGEESKCKTVREIITQVDWDCEIKTLFQTKNLGCKWGEFTAMDWFFAHVEEGIIIEDDVLSDSSMFSYFKELLIRYSRFRLFKDK